jgi:hypothetical protein
MRSPLSVSSSYRGDWNSMFAIARIAQLKGEILGQV